VKTACRRSRDVGPRRAAHEGPCQAAILIVLFLCISCRTMSRFVGEERKGPYRLHELGRPYRLRLNASVRIDVEW